MENQFFEIEYDSATGGIFSLILKNDPHRMNWIRGTSQWGIPKRSSTWWGQLENMQFLGMEHREGRVISRYRHDALELCVTRTLTGNGIQECYTFSNIDSADLFVQRGEIGLYMTFEDRYDSALVSQTQNCNVHLWCGGENSWIHALKMGPFAMELGLFLTRGALDSYSVERSATETSNDRGDFLLHPAPFHLRPGESYELAWELNAFPTGDFATELLKFPNLNLISAENETVFQGEEFHWTIRNGFPIKCGEAFCNGESIPCRVQGDTMTVAFRPDSTGEHLFEFHINGNMATARGLCSAPWEELLKQRVECIVNKQQNMDENSPLFGAYLIYDFEEGTQFYSSFGPSRNAGEERLSMGMLVCKYLQKHPDDRIQKSLDLFEQFLLREIYDPETGMVYRNVGKHPESKRLYNIPWMVSFWQEMFTLKQKDIYLEYAQRSLFTYYKDGGKEFYPNACDLPEFIRFLRDVGRPNAELERSVREHAERFRLNGVDYPEHEVRFEQTIISPAATMFASWNRNLEIVPEYFTEAERHIQLLERFQGHQPDYRLNEIPIRHWDDFWFGKRRLLGDTFPHYWSCLSAYAFALYALITGKEEYNKKAQRCLRNCLCLFRPDGSASCAYVYPYSVALTDSDGTIKELARRGEFYDPWANDQDWALYYILKTEELCGSL